MITTALDMIKSALNKIRVLGTGDVLSDEDAQLSLDTLNMMMESWSLDHLYVYTESQVNFPLVQGQYNYTVGVGGDFNVDRPLKLLTAFTRSQGIDYPMEVLDNATQYDAIRFKGVVSSWPMAIWYEQSFPLGTLHFYPAPTSGQAYLRFWTQLQSFAALNTAIVLPTGYKECIVFNLAVALSGDFGIEPSPTVVAKAGQSTARLKRYNSKAITVGSEAAYISNRHGRYSIMSDGYY